MSLFAPQPKDNGKLYRPLWKMVPALLFILFFAHQSAVKAVRERDTARRQETTFGNVVDCKPAGKSGKYCHYVFQTIDEQSYVGGSQASSDIDVNQTVNVYYDSQNPRICALESFYVKSRDDQMWAYILLLIAGASIAFGFYSTANLRSDKQLP